MFGFLMRILRLSQINFFYGLVYLARFAALREKENDKVRVKPQRIRLRGKGFENFGKFHNVFYNL
jgi:hypothetical protein